VSKTLTLDDFLSADTDASRKLVSVEVPELGGRVFVREMTAAERDAYDATLFDADGKPVRENWRARMVAMTACDEQGQLLFSPQHAELLGRKSAAVIARIYREAARLNRLTEEAAAEGKGDSPGGTGDDSP